jgi:citrate lyase subunit beta / citryl-CoA lyase
MPAAGDDAQAPGRDGGGLMRSLLFVPGDDPRKLDRAMGSGADALILDLEDSVASGRKGEARRITAGFLADAIAAKERPKLFVRVNALGTGLADADLDAVVPGAPDGIVLPKTEGGADLATLGHRLSPREAKAGLPEGRIRILAIATETARGVFATGSLAEARDRLAGIAWGGEDLAADIGAETNRGPSGGYAEPYRLARTLTLLAAAAAGVDPVDAVFTDYRDLDGLAAECTDARRDGFTAKMAIHPAQVPVINEAFTPSAEALAWARGVIEAFAANPQAGVVGIEGAMIDRPHLKRAERLMRRAPAAG